jgi:alpha-D-ribose 1-methylphosphonate 5-triphosphate synthase subunit PhnH
MSDMLGTGFDNPVMDAQRCFRAVLDAMARPGTVHQVNGIEPPPPLDVSSAAVLLTLTDNETPVWLAPELDCCRSWLSFHAGARFAPLPQAMFAVARTMPALDTLNPGTHEEPENAATLILQVPALGRGRALTLRGPGVRDSMVLAIGGLPDDFVLAWRRNRSRFPRGIDLILCAGDRLACLPRSISVEE